MTAPSRQAGFSPWSLLFLAMGVALLGAFFMQDIPLLVSGARTTATIDAIEGEGRRHVYLRVSFRMEDGTPVRIRIHQSMTSDYAVGERVDIAYLRTNPETAEILTVSQLGTSVLMKILLGSTALLLGIFGLMPERKTEAERKKG